MLSTEDPTEFWKAIGRLSGWRLLSTCGFEAAAFTTGSGNTVQIGYEVAQLLDTLVCTLGDLADDIIGLADVTDWAVFGSAAQKRQARKHLEKTLDKHITGVHQLRSELPQMFKHYDATETGPDRFIEA